jgi:hypothetical protein
MSGQPTSRPTFCSERKTQNRALRKEPVPSEAEGMGHPRSSAYPLFVALVGYVLSPVVHSGDFSVGALC